MWPFKKKKNNAVIKEGLLKQSFSERLENAYGYYKYYTEDLITWFADENDPIKLGSAYCIINCWGWPNFMPMPDPSFDFKQHGFSNKEEDCNYEMIRFTQTLMKDLQHKCEKISPGTCQQIWLSQVYDKYNLMPIEPKVQVSDTTDDQ